MLWHLGTEAGSLELVAELAGHTGLVRKVSWCEQNPEALISLEEGRVRAWTLRGASAHVQSYAVLSSLMSSSCTKPDMNLMGAAGMGSLQPYYFCSF